MADLSQLSDQELDNLIASKSQKSALSSLPDSQLDVLISSGVTQNKPKTGALAAFAGGVGQSFPFAEEAAAGLYSLTHKGATYDDTLKSFREGNKQYAEERPLAFYGGAIAPALVPIGSAASKGGSLLARAARGSAVGAAQGALYGYGAGEGGVENRVESATEGAKFGGIVGGALPVAAAGVKSAANAVIPKLDKPTAQLTQRAQELGIPLRMDQIAPTRARKTVQKISQELPFSGVDSFEQGQRTAFNKAVANTIGAESLSPDGVNAFLDRVGGVFDDAIKGKMISTTGLNTKLDNIVTNAKNNVSDDIVKIVRNNVTDVKNSIKGGIVNGQKIASARSTLVNRLKTADGRAKSYIGDAIQAIDDVVSPQIGEKSSEALKVARRQWRNYRTLEPLLEKATDGQINPTELLNKVQASKYIKASRTSTGKDDLVDLARIGKQFLPKAGGSDTFQKSLYTAGGLSALGGAGTIGTVPTAITAAVTLASNRAFQKLYNTSGKAVKASIDRALKGNPQIIEDIMNLPTPDARRALIALSQSEE